MLLPDLSSAGRSIVVTVTLVDTSGFLAGSSEASGFSVLVDRVADPVVAGVSSDGLVRWVQKNDLEVLVDRVLVDPVRVQDSQVSSTTANTFLGGGT